VNKVGAEGYIHGYICVRPPCGKVGDAVDHPAHGPGVITAVDDHGAMHARFSDGTEGQLGKPKVPVTTLVGLGQDPGGSLHSKVPPNLTTAQEQSLKQLAQITLTEHMASEATMADLHDEVHTLQGKIAVDTEENAKQDSAWHLCLIIAGLLAAAAATIATGGASAPVLIGLGVGVMPNIAQELVDRHHNHQNAQDWAAAKLHVAESGRRLHLREIMHDYSGHVEVPHHTPVAPHQRPGRGRHRKQ
jgi:hypothetical protein